MPVVDEYLNAIKDFEERLSAIDNRHGTYAEIEVRDYEITSYSDMFPVYAHNISLNKITLRCKYDNN